MDLKENVRDLAKRAQVAKNTAETEEATKNAVVMPFIRALGFDVFDLSQVVPEFTADVGVKRGEKVDYALRSGDESTILIEAKSIRTDLKTVQYNQLYRYFSVTDARIAILTNGLQFWFFTDLDSANKMDRRPFFILDLESYDDLDVRELQKFHRDAFSVDEILQTAASLKYTTAAANFLRAQMEAPEDELVRIVGKQIYDGNLTKAVVDQLRPAVRGAFRNIISDRIQERFSAALSTEDDVPAAPAVSSDTADKIDTTEDEWEAFHIVRAIAAEIVEVDRVAIRDAKSYCGILFDDNNRKPVCRLHFNSKNTRYLGLFDASRTESRIKIEKPKDIYAHKTAILELLRGYVDGN